VSWPSANWPEPSEGRARDHAAETVDISPRSVENVGKVLRGGASELVEQVDKGTIAVSAAATLTGVPQ